MSERQRVSQTSAVGASAPRLTSTSYALLGAIAQAGPCSPYELKRVLARRVGPLWEIPHSQIYDEAARLARAGLLTEAQEGTGRRRLTYAITEEGRRELLRWLRMPGRDRVELRDVGLLKMAFADELQPAELRHVAEDHAELWVGLADELAQTMTGAGGTYAVAVANAAASFWRTLADSLPSELGPLGGVDRQDSAAAPSRPVAQDDPVSDVGSGFSPLAPEAPAA
ncbi:MAG: PadR family transcriptional regulator [Acidimicrobiales bacterium]